MPVLGANFYYVKHFVMFLSEKSLFYLSVICVKHFVMFLSEKSLSI